MNKIENLRDELQRRFTDATFRMSPPVRAEDQWTLDIRYKDRWIVVDWIPPARFAVSSASENTIYGEGPDELYSDSEETIKRIEELLATEEITGKYRCKMCGCFWRLHPPSEVQPDGSWSLWNGEQKPRPCCNNVAMGEQIEPI